jgi:hypothetical protein
MATKTAVPAPPRFQPDEVVEAVESFWSWTPHGDAFTRKGARLRGDNFLVGMHPDRFLKQGSTDAEIAAAVRIVHPEREPTPHVPMIHREEELQDVDAMLCIKGVRGPARDADTHIARPLAVAIGMRLHRDDPLVKANPKSFVPIVAPGLDPSNAVRAKGDRYETRRDASGNLIAESDGVLRQQYGDYKRFVIHYAGQWIPREDADVQAHPERYEVIPG